VEVPVAKGDAEEPVGRTEAQDVEMEAEEQAPQAEAEEQAPQADAQASEVNLEPLSPPAKLQRPTSSPWKQMSIGQAFGLKGSPPAKSPRQLAQEKEAAKLAKIKRTVEELKGQEKEAAAASSDQKPSPWKGGSLDKHGQPRTNRGGRPRLPDDELRGVHGGLKSNRRAPGQKPRRLDRPASVKLQMAKHMKEARSQFPADAEGEREYWKKMVSDYDWGSNLGGYKAKRKALKFIRDNEDKWEARVKKLQLGKGTGITKHQASGKKMSRADGFQQRSGAREEGGGTQNKWAKIWSAVQIWHAEERKRGHHVDRADIFLEFVDTLVAEIRNLQHKQATVGELSKEEQDQMDAGVRKIRVLSVNQKERERYICQLMGAIGAKELRPSRFTELTPDEEAIRAKLTWQSNDRQLWIGAFGSEEELKRVVVDPKKWKEMAPHTVLVYSDQIPFWVSLGLPKLAYAKFEREAVAQARKRRKKMKAQGSSFVKSNALQPSQGMQLHEEVGEGQTQMRGTATDGDDKVRVTFRNRLAIFKYYQEGEEPVGAVLPTIIIVHGAHARLSNIDDEGRWIETEQFYSSGEKIIHKAGASAGGALSSYVALRKEKPELFKDVIVFSSPAANETSVTEIWQTQDLEKRVGQCIHQRDMYSAGLSEEARKAHQLCQSLSTWIAGKMTPVLQLTDTDASKTVQDACRRKKMDLMLETKMAAEAAGTKPVYSCGAEQIMELASAAHEALVKKQLAKEFVVAGAYRNGMLAYRPSFTEGKLVKSCEQEWAKKLQLGSHRLKESWLTERYNWLDENGVPIEPDYSESSAKRLEEMEEPTMEPAEACLGEDYVVKIGGTEITCPVLTLNGWDEMENIGEDDLQVFLHPRERRRRAALKKVSLQKVRRRIVNKRKYWEDLEARTAKLREHRKTQCEGWQDYLEFMLKTHSAQDILKNYVIPVYSGKSKKSKQAVAKALTFLYSVSAFLISSP